MNSNIKQIEQKDCTTSVISGGAGNVGSYIVELLAKYYKGSNIVVIDNMYNGNLSNLDRAYEYASENDNRIHFYRDDITNYRKMDFIFDVFRPNYVFHQASLLTLDSRSARYEAIECGVMGSVNMFELSLRYGVEKVIFASSASVYGNPDYFPTDERHHFRNNSLLYGANKISVEHIAKSYSDNDGLKFISFRPFNITSPRQSDKNIYVQIVPKFINAFIDGKDITIYGNGQQTLDIIHAEDVARYNILAAQSGICKKNPDYFEGFINACSGKETSVLQLTEIIEQLLTSKGIDCTRSKIIYEEHDPNLVKRRLGDTSLLHSFFGKQEKTVIEIIDECVDSILLKRGLK